MRFERFEAGQGMMEYALIVALIAVVAIIVLSLIGTRISTAFSQIASTMQ